MKLRVLIAILALSGVLEAGTGSGVHGNRGERGGVVMSVVVQEVAPQGQEPPPPPISRSSSVPAEARATPDGLVVRVVRHEGAAEHPVAGARIEVSGEDSEITFPETDAEGISRASRYPWGDISLRARKGEDVSLRSSWSPSGPWRPGVQLVLLPTRYVRVHLRDREGHPVAGVAVGMDELPGLYVGTEVTDGRGLATLSLRGESLLHLRFSRKPTRAFAYIGKGPVASAPLSWDNDVTTEAEINIDRSVLLAIRIVDRTGAPAAVSGTLSWSKLENEPAFVGDRQGSRLPIDGSSAIVPGCEGGAELRLTLVEQGRLSALLGVRVPRGVPEHEVILTRGLEAPRLEIPLVNSRGEPVTTGRYALHLQRGSDDIGTKRSVEPREDGALVLELDGLEAGRAEVALLPRAGWLFDLPPVQGLETPYFGTFGIDPYASRTVLAVRSFPRVAPGEARRLPAITVPSAERLLSGRVVDASGHPAPGVGIMMRPTSGPVSDAMRRFETFSDSEGRFEIHANELPSELILWGRRMLGFCPPVRVRVTGDQVQLKVARSGTLEIDLQAAIAALEHEKVYRFPGTHPEVTLTVQEETLEPAWRVLFHDRGGDGGAIGRWSIRRALSPEKPLIVPNLVPASYTVEIRLDKTPVLFVRDVRVEAGETTRDPRLHGSAVAKSIEASVVRVRDPEGAPVADVLVAFRVPSWEAILPDGFSRGTDSDGEAWFLLPKGIAIDIDLSRKDLAPVHLEAVTFPVEAVMGEGTALEVSIQNAGAVRDMAHGITLSLQRFRDRPPASPITLIADREVLPESTVPLDLDTGRSTFRNLAPGHYRLWLATHRNPRTLRLPPGQRTTFVLLGDYTVTPDSPAHLSAIHHLDDAQLVRLRAAKR